MLKRVSPVCCILTGVSNSLIRTRVSPTTSGYSKLFHSFARSSSALKRIPSRPAYIHIRNKRPDGIPNLTRTMSAAAMSKRLSGKTILITGASSGIGRSTALEFARTSPQNLKLIVTARRLENLQKLQEEIKAEVGEGVAVHPVQLDMQDVKAIKSFVAGLPAEFREIDVLVNNAGLVRGRASVGEIAEEDIDVMFQTNVTGLIALTQEVLRIYKKRPDGGRGDIINLGSIAGREPYVGGSIYCATKAAVRSFTDAMRRELIDTRIRIIEIDPGMVETEFSLVRFYGDKSKADAVYADCEPLTPDDIAEIIVFTAGRRENVVIADTLIFPQHQGGAAASAIYKKPKST